VIIFFRKRYPGDLSSDDFDTPTKRKRNFATIKGALKRKNFKIKSLQSHVRFLKRKIFNLKGLLDYFKQKSYLSEHSASIVKVCIYIKNTACKLFDYFF